MDRFSSSGLINYSAILYLKVQYSLQIPNSCGIILKAFDRFKITLPKKPRTLCARAAINQPPKFNVNHSENPTHSKNADLASDSRLALALAHDKSRL